jgi:hypothetical protein
MVDIERRNNLLYEHAVDQLLLGGCVLRDGDEFFIRSPSTGVFKEERIGREVAQRLLRRPDVRFEEREAKQGDV